MTVIVNVQMEVVVVIAVGGVRWLDMEAMIVPTTENVRQVDGC